MNGERTNNTARLPRSFHQMNRKDVLLLIQSQDTGATNAMEYQRIIPIAHYALENIL